MQIKTLCALTALAISGTVAAPAQAVVFDYTGAPTYWSVPVSGLYDIFAYGAAGGASTYNGNVLASGGLGAAIGGSFNLSAGDQLYLVVGGAGGNADFFGGGGGGGGSFVLRLDPVTTALPLAIAGGGGGGGVSGSAFNDLNASASQNGNRSPADPGNGNGGVSGAFTSYVSNPDGSITGTTIPGAGGGGMGYNGPGGAGANPIDGGAGSLYGGAGGQYSAPGVMFTGGHGGFGGGGGGAALSDYFNGGGGGGGGYTGGNGGLKTGPNASFSGTGGGSFLAATAMPVFAAGGFRSGDGTILVNLVSAAPPVGGVPEPASWAMLIAGFGLTGAAMRQRRGAAVVSA